MYILASKEPNAPMGLAIQRMFDGIARRYDFLNHFLSAGRDRAWRRNDCGG